MATTDPASDAEKIATILTSTAEDQKRALRVPCPTCGAAIDEPCHAAAHPDKPVVAHIARLDAAAPLGMDDDNLRSRRYIMYTTASDPRRTEKKRAWLLTLHDIYADELHRRQQAAGQDGPA